MFDTIFAEGQRCYVESLPAHARQFLGQMDKPDVDFIEGLSPMRPIDQEVDQPQPAVYLVGTITEVQPTTCVCCIRAGTPHCPVCGERIARQTLQQIVDQVLAMDEGLRFPGARARRTRKGEFVDLSTSSTRRATAACGFDGGICSPTRRSSRNRKSTTSRSRWTGSMVKATAQRLTDSVETARTWPTASWCWSSADREDDHPTEQRF